MRALDMPLLKNTNLELTRLEDSCLLKVRLPLVLRGLGALMKRFTAARFTPSVGGVLGSMILLVQRRRLSG